MNREGESVFLHIFLINFFLFTFFDVFIFDFSFNLIIFILLFNSTIHRSKCLPGKSIGQIYMQTQRLIGQQSLGGKRLFVNIEKNQMDLMKN